MVPSPLATLPDVLVLGAGGTLGEAWMRGLLSGATLAGGPDFAECERILGTSAGSIVAAVLASGHPLEIGDRAARDWGRATPDGNGMGDDDEAGHGNGNGTGRDDASKDGADSSVASDETFVGRALRASARLGLGAAQPLASLAPLALSAGAPAGALARAALLTRAPRPERTLAALGRRLDELGSSFDGRLRIFVVDRATGRRVELGAPGAPESSVSDAVLASCAVPWIFAPVTIGGREYVDGGVWSPTNLDAAPVRPGTHVLCLSPAASLATSRSAFGLIRAFAQSAAVAESVALRARGAEVRIIGPDPEAARVMGPNLMDYSRIDDVLDAGFAQGRRLARGQAG